jgi:uncharacterized OsmC-like protein
MIHDRDYHVTLTLAQGYEFIAEFTDRPAPPPVHVAEAPPPPGNGGPDSAALLGAALGECVAAGLTHRLRKGRVTVHGLTASVTTHVFCDEAGRFGIRGVDVELAPCFADIDSATHERCQRMFHEFCSATATATQGISVHVTVTEPARTHKVAANGARAWI